jgi:hypothetical protein
VVTVPERIWLQNVRIFEYPTWCDSKIEDGDVEYIRHDKYADLQAENERLLEALEMWKQGYADASADRDREREKWIKSVAENAELERKLAVCVSVLEFSLDWLDEVTNPDNEELATNKGVWARKVILDAIKAEKECEL